eukprot:3941078-Rhodomonas_salina.2
MAVPDNAHRVYKCYAHPPMLLRTPAYAPTHTRLRSYGSTGQRVPGRQSSLTCRTWLPRPGSMIRELSTTQRVAPYASPVPHSASWVRGRVWVGAWARVHSSVGKCA